MNAKTVTYSDETYQTRHIAARVKRELDEHPGLDLADAVQSVMLGMVARRRFGKAAWVHSTRLDRWSEDESVREYQVTVIVGPERYGSAPYEHLWIAVDRDEVAAIVAAVEASLS